MSQGDSDGLMWQVSVTVYGEFCVFCMR